MNPTDEQTAILDAVRTTRDNLMLVARAGCGKSSTLKLIDRADANRPHLYMVFNKKNAVEAIDSGDFHSSTTIKTYNGLGHGIWAAATGKKLALQTKKINFIFKDIVDDAPRAERHELWERYNAVKSAVDTARAFGYIPAHHAKASKRLIDFTGLIPHLDETPDETTAALIDQVLMSSISMAYDGTIDFNDQIYMPALFGGTYPKFPLVMIDEYQDLSPINMAMTAKLCQHSRQIGVGDPAQAIYAFRGAMDDGMDVAINRFSMTTLPLSLSFRCPSAIVKNVQWHVPDFRAVRDGGAVNHKHKFTLEENSTVICRNNGPLLSLAMSQVIAGHKVDLAGIDIGHKVIHQLSKLGPEELTQGQTIGAIADWLAKKEAADSKSAKDLAQCMRVFAMQGKTLGQAIAYAKHIFAQSGTIFFTSGHRSKGQEYDNVYHLDARLCTTDGQDPNVKYVIDTRAKESLTYIETGGHHLGSV